VVDAHHERYGRNDQHGGEHGQREIAEPGDGVWTVVAGAGQPDAWRRTTATGGDGHSRVVWPVVDRGPTFFRRRYVVTLSGVRVAAAAVIVRARAAT